jgi:cytochrome c biogenesis protein CcdA
MFLYSQLMVLPILFLIFTVGWKVKTRLERYGRILDIGVGIMLTVLAAYYIVSALGLA